MGKFCELHDIGWRRAGWWVRQRPLQILHGTTCLCARQLSMARKRSMVRGSPEQPEPEPEPEESPLSLQGVPAHLRGAEVFPSCSGHASPPYCGSGAHAELALRCEAFARGEWLTRLHADARTRAKLHTSRPHALPPTTSKPEPNALRPYSTPRRVVSCRSRPHRRAPRTCLRRYSRRTPGSHAAPARTVQSPTVRGHQLPARRAVPVPAACLPRRPAESTPWSCC